MKRWIGIAIAVIVALALVLTACQSNKTDAAEYKLKGGQKAIIILPGLLASGLYDSETQQMLWDPFAEDDLDLLIVMGAYPDKEIGDFIAQFDSLIPAMEYAVDCLNDDPDNPSILRRIMCDEQGDPVYSTTVGVPYDNPAHQRYGALNSYRSMAQNLQALYGKEYRVEVFNYNWLADTRLAARQLADYMRENNMTESILVAHSMGGIVGNNFLAMSAENRARIDKFITLATPFYGSYSVNDWFEDASFLKEMAMPALQNMGLNKFADNFENFYDNVVLPLLYNMTSMYQLLPSPELMPLSGTTAGVQIDGQTIEADKLYDFYCTRAWSTLAPTNPSAAADLPLRKQMVDWPAYRDGFYVQKGSERIFAADLVDTYYIAGTQVSTVQGVSYTEQGMTDIYGNDGDGTVSFLSATRGKPVDNEHVFATHGVEHIVLGCYFNGEQAQYLQQIIGPAVGDAQ